MGHTEDAMSSGALMPPPPPRSQSPVTVPSPLGGGRSLGPKSIGNTRGYRRRRKIFFRLYWNCCSFSATFVWCNPPPPPLRGIATALGGGFQGGAR